MVASFPQRKIGGTSVSALGLGCMGMSMSALTGEKRDDEEIFNTLTTAADMGITFWDTSDFYLDNEEILGNWFSKTGRRKEIFLATKFGCKHGPGGLGDVQISGSPEYVRESIEKSLKTLGTDYIDLYYVHRIDPRTPIEKTVEVLAELKLAGKIRHIGLSECSSRTLERASKVAKIDAVQMEFSPFAMEIEDTGFKDVARKLGVTIVPYSPLGRGFLSGAIKSRADFGPNDPRPRMHPRFSEENFPGNLKLVQIFEDIAKEKGVATGQVALAWVLAQGDDFIPIPGTKRVKYLLENAGAVKVNFTDEDEKRVRSGLDAIGGAKGARYPEANLAGCFGDSPELGSV
ncbi:aldo-keto reductase [Paraphaeosphaeria sporulosa]|uniref:Aldo-keto reductase n=1 Tax=Paraphaeosphaeria sporulosa TaxID=1460663 RepID=A0A177CAK2_9PLEO|nr:aldo-keto reductase [Paraphaeosphaeria sporulosa]OAG04605.1 aldo-keto reductase [Paraphaeosphaeria sporulosa]